MGDDGSHGVGTTVDSGLPNIFGSFKLGWPDASGGGIITSSSSITGAFYGSHENPACFTTNGQIQSNESRHINWIGFNASNYNAIYGRSSIVQPPAFFCNFWKRLS